MKCPYCKQDFTGPIPRGLHLWARRDGRCSTPQEMAVQGWYLYYGQWMTSKPAWLGQEEWNVKKIEPFPKIEQQQKEGSRE